MIRIGLLGCQSTHAVCFAKAVNIPDEQGNYLIDDCRITAVCGYDDTLEHIKETASLGHIENIVDTPEELMNFCDAVMILKRTGETRVSDALPFIEKGIPVFLDKPVCKTKEEIEFLNNIIIQKDIVLAGGSGLKLCRDILNIKKDVESGKFGKIFGISLNHNGDTNCIYDGIYFYVCHSIEMMLTILGHNPISVRTSTFDNTNFSIFVNYDDMFANLILTSSYNKNFVTVYGEKMNETYTVDSSDIFKNIMIDYADRIRNKKYTRSVFELTNHVRILNAIDESLKDTKTIII